MTDTVNKNQATYVSGLAQKAALEKIATDWQVNLPMPRH